MGELDRLARPGLAELQPVQLELKRVVDRLGADGSRPMVAMVESKKAGLG